MFEGKSFAEKRAFVGARGDSETRLVDPKAYETLCFRSAEQRSGARARGRPATDGFDIAAARSPLNGHSCTHCVTQKGVDYSILGVGLLRRVVNSG